MADTAKMALPKWQMLPKWHANKIDSMRKTRQKYAFYFFLELARNMHYIPALKNDTYLKDSKMMTIQPAPGMYFTAIRNRDDKVFIGEIANIKSMGMKGTMVVVKLADSPKYATVYLDECYDYAWSDFPLPALPGR